MQPVVVPPPGLAHPVGLLEDERVDATLPQRRGHGETPGARTDDDDLLGCRVLRHVPERTPEGLRGGQSRRIPLHFVVLSPRPRRPR
ncbi:hypothetical protein GCM10012283_21060 [Phycicoccus endophyticus]|nr:hypothetical protein GCM10012283_21060 [Phycicoccus endophyticus]